MNSVSEILFALGAVILFSIVLISINGSILLNVQNQVASEFEYNAVAAAQDIIEEARSKAFDEAVVGGGEIEEINDLSSISTDGCNKNDRECFNDFDDYYEYSDTLNTQLGDDTFEITVDVEYVDEDYYESTGGTKTKWKKMTVYINSDYLENSIALTYIRGYL